MHFSKKINSILLERKRTLPISVIGEIEFGLSDDSLHDEHNGFKFVFFVRYEIQGDISLSNTFHREYIITSQ